MTIINKNESDSVAENVNTRTDQYIQSKARGYNIMIEGISQEVSHRVS